jgi:hypothetical protein
MADEHYCKQEKILGELLEANRNFKEFMKDIKDNHLTSIYRELKCITAKMSSRRPSWSVAFMLTFLTTLCGILITVLLKK